MLIVPELKKVFILVPRTGSGTFYREMQRVYPRAMLLYRHMEANAVPLGYDRWDKVGFVRHPLARLWSLYNFLKTFGGGAQVQGGDASADALRLRAQVNKPFLQWLHENDAPFTTPVSPNGDGAAWPVLSRLTPLPENKMSQWDYLRPDLGTTVWKFENLRKHMADLGLDPSVVKNWTGSHATLEGVEFDDGCMDHILRFDPWALDQDCAFL